MLHCFNCMLPKSFLCWVYASVTFSFFGVGDGWDAWSKIHGVERSLKVHLCLGKCYLRCCHFKFTASRIAEIESVSGHISFCSKEMCLQELCKTEWGMFKTWAISCILTMATFFHCFSELVWKSDCSLFNWCFWIIFSLWLQSLCRECPCSGKWLTKLAFTSSRGQPCPSSVWSLISCFCNPASVLEEVELCLKSFLLSVKFPTRFSSCQETKCSCWGEWVHNISFSFSQSQNNAKSFSTLLCYKVFLIACLSG